MLMLKLCLIIVNISFSSAFIKPLSNFHLKKLFSTKKNETLLSTSFSLNTEDTMSKLLKQAQALRDEAASVDDSKRSLNFRDELAGFIRDDVIVNKTTVNTYTLNASSPVSSSSSPLPTATTSSLLTPRENEADRLNLLQSLGGINNNNPLRTLNSSSMMDLIQSINMSIVQEGISATSVQYNLSALPDVEPIVAKFPFVVKLIYNAAKSFTLANPEDEMDKVKNTIFMTAAALEIEWFLNVNDDGMDGLTMELWQERFGKSCEDLTRLCLSASIEVDADVELGDVPAEEISTWLSTVVDVDAMGAPSFDLFVDGFKAHLAERGWNGTEALNGVLLAQSLSDYSTKISMLSMDNSTVSELTTFMNEFDDLIRVYNDEQSITNTAERVIIEYFEQESRQNGLVLNREAAGRLQTDVLKDIFVVTGVDVKLGVVVFKGRPVGKIDRFTSLLAERYEASPYKEEFKYFVLQNENYPGMSNSMEEMALESLTGSGPAVILYPASWNTTVTKPLRDTNKQYWRSFMISSALISAGMFAGDCIDASTNAAESFLPLAFGAIFLQTIGAIAEVFYAAIRRFNVSLVLTPSLRIGTWGPRTLYTSMPANRNDMFDAAFLGAATTLLLSFGAILLGLDLTVNTPPEALESLPSIPLALVKANGITSEIFQWKFPQILADAPKTLHLHWLAISGLTSFIATSFNLIPIDNSAGSKMSSTIVGLEGFVVLNAVSLFIRLVFLLPFIFDISGSPDLTARTILVDFFFASQFVGNVGENQLAVDNVTPLSDGRKTAFLGLVLFLVYSFLPFSQVSSEFNDVIASGFNYVKELWSRGGVSSGGGSMF